MDAKGFSWFKTDPWIFLLILTLIGIFDRTTTSDCDVEFVYSEYFNSNGFKVTCKDLEKGQENIIRYISAHNALLLLIRNTTLVNVTSDLFENVPKIRELTIEDSKILVDGYVDLFSKLEILQKLNLKNTKLREIGNGTFSNLLQIKSLHLENNSITAISRDSFKLNSLEILEFINNELKDIEDIPLCDLPYIRVLNFKKNRLKSLKPDLFQCTPPKMKSSPRNSFYENNHLSVESIDLSNNEITTLDGAFKSFRNLNHLRLENNSISRISDRDFEIVLNLEYLNLSNNCIYSISRVAFNRLYKLKQVDLSRNKIVNVNLKSLDHLSEIYLAHNEITFENTQNINHLKNLKHLDLSYNDLNGSSYFFNNFPTLLTLNLNGNNLILENYMFENLSKLENLYLSANGILFIPNSIFIKTTSLIELDLSKNELKTLEYKDIFSSLSNLQMLNLSYNNLKSLDPTLFITLDNVEVLDIAGNKLKELNYALITNNMRALETVNIKENLFSCNFLHRIVRYFAWKGISYNADNITYYNEENIGGIQCQEEGSAVEHFGMTPSPHNTVIFVIVLASAISSVFILLFVFIMKYYHFYRRRKYQCEQFELIED